jgi:two-component sensor histidine kinase
MKIDNAIHIGLIINEIITNSFKHGIINSDNKFIQIRVRSDNESGIELSVSDNGNGIEKLADNNFSTGFGASLIYSLVNQLNGSIELNKLYSNEIFIKFNNICA